MTVPPQTSLPDVLRWVPWHNPNPPDPWIQLVLQVGDPAHKQAAMQSFARLNAAQAQAQAQFWADMEKAAGGAKTG